MIYISVHLSKKHRNKVITILRDSLIFYTYNGIHNFSEKSKSARVTGIMIKTNTQSQALSCQLINWLFLLTTFRWWFFIFSTD